MTSYSKKLEVPGKTLLTSKTIWGSLLAILPELVTGVNELLSTGVLPPDVATVLHVVGAGLAFFGRLTATKKIN